MELWEEMWPLQGLLLSQSLPKLLPTLTMPGGEKAMAASHVRGL